MVAVFKSDTKQAWLNGDIGDENIYLSAPDWWQERVPEGHALLLMKSIYCTRQAARPRQWRVRISTWMEDHGYRVVNSENTEKTIFMKRLNTNRIMDGLFVDDIAYASTSEALKKAVHRGDFEITFEATVMTSFLGMEVEQDNGSIRLHLDTDDTCIQETPEE
jgi:hypothetical protein